MLPWDKDLLAIGLKRSNAITKVVNQNDAIND